MENLIIEGDLLDCNSKYIIHQCNCVTKTGHAAGIAASIFDKFEYANVYIKKYNSQPGTIEIRGNGVDQRFVVAFYSQYYPGSPMYPNSTLDGYEVRFQYFRNCLIELMKIPNLESVAFPYKIGCGIAGGDWDRYNNIIKSFNSFINKYQPVDVKIIKL